MSLGSAAQVAAIAASAAVALSLALGHTPPGLHALPLFYNTSPSLPTGLYVTRNARLLQKGDLVRACVPEAYAATALERSYLHPGSCKGGAAHIGKFIVGLAGDTVYVDSAGVVVNGLRLRQTQPWHRDGRGRDVEHYTVARILAHGECFLISAMDPMSYDSRYFGPTKCDSPYVKLVPVGDHAQRLVAAHALRYIE